MYTLNDWHAYLKSYRFARNRSLRDSVTKFGTFLIDIHRKRIILSSTADILENFALCQGLDIEFKRFHTVNAKCLPISCANRIAACKWISDLKDIQIQHLFRLLVRREMYCTVAGY